MYDEESAMSTKREVNDSGDGASTWSDSATHTRRYLRTHVPQAKSAHRVSLILTKQANLCRIHCDTFALAARKPRTRSLASLDIQVSPMAQTAMFGILEAVAVPHSGIYASCEELMNDLNSRAEKQGYKIVKSRSHRSRPGAPICRADLVCERGGRPYICQATKHKTSTKKTNCPWKAKAVNRKVVGGWVLTVICDHHNHEPGTPEPPTPSEQSEVEDNEQVIEETGALPRLLTVQRPTSSADVPKEGPRPDPETSAALQIAGVADNVLRLSGDTFHRFKTEYRKMSQPERLGILSQMQLRIAAIYAVQNEEMQRQRRQDAQNKRHQEIEEQKRRLEAQGLQSSKRKRASQFPPLLPRTEGTDASLSEPQEQDPPLDQSQTPVYHSPTETMQISQAQLPAQNLAPPAPTPPMPQFRSYQGPSKRGRGGRKAQASLRPIQPSGQQPPQQLQPQITEQSTQSAES
ncbi:hypothetical protein HIM_00813 [Hirsutella minnesotensis 3608]|nr:hypothetical protein HIM_00813 [Hirsutella minnesotensis 3608]